jgi:Phosphotransferase enzyme family
MSTFTRENSERIACAGRLLAEAGYGGAFELVPLSGGANSKAFRVNLATGAAPLFLKEYFQHADDARDRLGTEFSFATFAWNHGLNSLARPFAMARSERCALFSYLEGQKLEPQEISREFVEQCLHFYRAINAWKASNQAKSLPAASEACFCLLDHWHCLERRVQRLQIIAPETALDQQALEFIHNQLAPACTEHLQQAKYAAVGLGLSTQETLAAADRCLSPSDFGFHNALLSAAGNLQFFDFEYAGWDDPAKTVCDFFCQPACPAPLECYGAFADELAKTMSEPAKHRRRFDLLLPMYQLKWCCIMLNDFLPSGGSRRRFALQGLDETERKTRQLHKARAALERYWGSARGAA